MSVEMLLDYKPLDLAMVLIPVFVAIAAVEILGIYYFKFKTLNDTKEWFLNIFLGVLIYFKIPQKIKGALEENILNIKKHMKNNPPSAGRGVIFGGREGVVVFFMIFLNV